MSKIELAIDIGSSHITIYQRGKGVVIKEPNIAIVSNNGKIEILEIGAKALSLLGRADRKLKPIYPVSEGVITQQEVFSSMIKILLSRLSTGKIFKPYITATALISQCLNDVERKNVEKALYDAGVKEVTLAESPLALFMDNKMRDGLYVNIGADLTEVSIVTANGIASGYTVNIGGNTFNDLICDRITNNYGVKIGKFTAEKLKKTIGSMYENDVNADEIRGLNIIDGEMVLIDVNAADVYLSIKSAVDSIAEVIGTLLNICPKELANKIVGDGIYLSGGSTLLPGLEEYLTAKTKINIVTMENITNAVAMGGGKLLENKTALSNLSRLKNI